MKNKKYDQKTIYNLLSRLGNIKDEFIDSNITKFFSDKDKYSLRLSRVVDGKKYHQTYLLSHKYVNDFIKPSDFLK